MPSRRRQGSRKNVPAHGLPTAPTDHNDASLPPVVVPTVPDIAAMTWIMQQMEGDVNPFTKKPFTPRYKQLLGTRTQLPVYRALAQFCAVYKHNQVMVVRGSTGSGKTTQIPQFVCYLNQRLGLQQTGKRLVACTLPRSLAFFTAKRVADEMDLVCGKEVGYVDQFESAFKPRQTILKYTKDSVLLREVLSDPDLSQYSTIIIDQVHERTSATDVLLAYLKMLARRRPDLKIIIMSAIASTKVEQYFSAGPESSNTAMIPLIDIAGGMHPVEVFYTANPEPDYPEAVRRTVLMVLLNHVPGDILVFLPSEDEVEAMCRRVRVEINKLLESQPDVLGPVICIPLHSSLSLPQLGRLYDPPPPPRHPGAPQGRKIIFTTDLAESSLALDGIAYVIDPGFNQAEVYNPIIRCESRLVSPTSKTSTRLRTACTGRTRPGKCFRLYTERDFMTELEEENHPEILKVDLTSLVLQLVKMGIKDIVHFDWIDAPSPEALMRALEALNYLAALTDEGELTSLGGVMAEFPIRPQLTKCLITSPEFRCVNEILTIVSMLSVSDIWVRPHQWRAEADAAKSRLAVPEGDHLTLLNIYEQWIQNRGDRNWAYTNFLSTQALLRASAIRKDLLDLLKHHEIETSQPPLSNERKRHMNVRKALVSAYFMQVGFRAQVGGGDYFVTVKDNQIALLHPLSDVDNQSKWVIFDKFALTDLATVPSICIVTQVQPDWLLEIAPGYFDLSTFVADADYTRALKAVINRRQNKQNQNQKKKQNAQ